MKTIKFGIRGKIYLGMISIVLLTGIMITAPVRIMVERTLAQESINKGLSIALSIASRSPDIMLGMDFFYLNVMIEKAVRSSNDISYSFILNNQEQVLSHTFQDGFPVELKTVNPVDPAGSSSIRLLDTGKEVVYDIAVPVLVGDIFLGSVHVGLSKTRINHTINQLLWMIVVLTGCSILIACLVGAVVANQFIRRIKKLHRASDQVIKGNLNVFAAQPTDKVCWNIMDCRNDICPAYGQMQQRCWYVEGTLCSECNTGQYSAKSDSCRTCKTYKTVSGDEIQSLAESFDAMTISLKQTITELNESRQSIEVSEEKYRRIYESSMDMVFVTDSNGNFLDINQAGKELLKLDSREIAEFKFSDIFANPSQYSVAWEDMVNHGFIKDMEITLKAMDGNELQALLSLSCNMESIWNPGGCDGMIKDITHRRNIEQQLLQADKLASLGQLSAGVAHEINNPLGLILGYTQLMIREEPDDSQKFEDLKTIEKHARNCKTIVEALLSFARKTETKKAHVDINSATEQVITVIRHQFELSGIMVETSYCPVLPRILGDAEKLKQVVMNLIMNARQAISQTGKIKVSTGFNSTSNQIEIIVDDTGSGIPVHQISRIFDPFFTTKPTGQGTGLGLSVSYGIVREHGGEIKVRSEPEKGSIFTVVLPAGKDLSNSLH